MSEEEDAASSHATSDGSDGRRTTDREALVFRSRVARLISQARERKGDLKRQRKVVRLLRRRPGKPGGGDDGGDSSSDNSDSTSGGEGSGVWKASPRAAQGVQRVPRCALLQCTLPACPLETAQGLLPQGAMWR